MEALLETTVWDTPYQPNHIYLMDGNKAVAYIRSNWKNDAGNSEPFYFKNPMQLDMRYRTFRRLSLSVFGIMEKLPVIEVQGKSGKYIVDVVGKRCSCPGFKFRGECKHVKEHCE